jgi:uncharacterized protein (DUF3084 family)
MGVKANMHVPSGPQVAAGLDQVGVIIDLINNKTKIAAVRKELGDMLQTIKDAQESLDSNTEQHNISVKDFESKRKALATDMRKLDTLRVEVDIKTEALAQAQRTWTSTTEAKEDDLEQREATCRTAEKSLAIRTGKIAKREESIESEEMTLDEIKAENDSLRAAVAKIDAAKKALG